MKKMAFFVEGQTELLFVTKLLIEMAGAKNIQVRQERKVRKNKFNFLKATSKNYNQEYYVLIRDCMGDASVKSEIIDALISLEKAGHEKVVGIRDVYPHDKYNIATLDSNLSYGLPSGGIHVQIFLAVMEIEAWFLAETTHFSKIDKSITLARIKSKLGFDPNTGAVEDRNHPSEDLDKIYRLARKRYKKTHNICKRTINALDYGAISSIVLYRVPRLKKVIDCINDFLS